MAHSYTQRSNGTMDDFLEQFDPEKGDEKQVKAVERSSVVYLSKKTPADMVVRLDKAWIHVSEKPGEEGQKKFLATLEVLEKAEGQDDLNVGDKTSYYVSMVTIGRTETAQRKSFEELCEFLSVVTGKPLRDFITNPKLVLEVCEDDAAEYQGTVLNMVTKPPKKGWHNYQWIRLDSYEEAAAE